MILYLALSGIVFPHSSLCSLSHLRPLTANCFLPGHAMVSPTCWLFIRSPNTEMPHHLQGWILWVVKPDLPAETARSKIPQKRPLEGHPSQDRIVQRPTPAHPIVFKTALKRCRVPVLACSNQRCPCRRAARSGRSCKARLQERPGANVSSQRRPALRTNTNTTSILHKSR